MQKIRAERGPPPCRSLRWINPHARNHPSRSSRSLAFPHWPSHNAPQLSFPPRLASQRLETRCQPGGCGTSREGMADSVFKRWGKALGFTTDKVRPEELRWNPGGRRQGVPCLCHACMHQSHAPPPPATSPRCCTTVGTLPRAGGSRGERAAARRREHHLPEGAT
jgi:hypothetical protein